MKSFGQNHFAELQAGKYFRNADIEYGTITWQNGQDFSSNTPKNLRETSSNIAQKVFAK
jgi:hypothetical protein